MDRKEEQAKGPDMQRRPEDQEIAYPNEGDPEERELGHLVGQTAEAQIGVFESGAPSDIDGKDPGPTNMPADAVQGAGDDHSVDLRDPADAKFVSVADRPMMTTSREHLPEPERGLAEEMAHRRSDDDIVVAAEPGKGVLDEEQAVLKHNPIKQKEPKEPMDR